MRGTTSRKLIRANPLYKRIPGTSPGTFRRLSTCERASSLIRAVLPHLKGFDCACTLATPLCAPDMQECSRTALVAERFCRSTLLTRYPTVDVSPAQETPGPTSPTPLPLRCASPLTQASRRTRAHDRMIVPERRRGSVSAFIECAHSASSSGWSTSSPADLSTAPLMYRRIVQPMRPSSQDVGRERQLFPICTPPGNEVNVPALIENAIYRPPGWNARIRLCAAHRHLSPSPMIQTNRRALPRPFPGARPFDGRDLAVILPRVLSWIRHAVCSSPMLGGGRA
jgi:hypothetical protein